MWSSSGGENQNNDNNLHSNGLSRGSSSSSSSSFASPFSPLPYKAKAKTMEEVWNDINLASLHHDDQSSRGLTFQDFLARPFCSGPPSSTISTISSLVTSPAPPPRTMLTLNSVPELHCFGDTVPEIQIVPQLCPSHNLPFDSFPAASGFSNAAEKKRFPQFDESFDRRHKRMIKNRESAARSRARKQAYTNELELEVAQLAEENAKLKKQQEQLYMATAAQQPKKYKLSRTTTAPF